MKLLKNMETDVEIVTEIVCFHTKMNGLAFHVVTT